MEYRLDGRLMASEVDLVGHRQLAYYLAGIDPALREHIDTSVLLVSGALELADRLHRAEYSFLRGDEDYKLRWRPDHVTAERVLLARPGLLGSGRILPRDRRHHRRRSSRSPGGPWTAARANSPRSVMHGIRQARAAR